MQRRPSVLIFRHDVSAFLREQFEHANLTRESRNMQRGPPTIVTCVYIFALLEQCAYAFEVAVTRGMKNVREGLARAHAAIWVANRHVG
jgi:hypothetical protein